MEIGIYTFADVAPGGSHPQRLRELVAEMELADQVGLDVFGLGEHHRPDYVVSARPRWRWRRGRRGRRTSASPAR